MFNSARKAWTRTVITDQGSKIRSFSIQLTFQPCHIFRSRLCLSRLQTVLACNNAFEYILPNSFDGKSTIHPRIISSPLFYLRSRLCQWHGLCTYLFVRYNLPVWAVLSSGPSQSSWFQRSHLEIRWRRVWLCRQYTSCTILGLRCLEAFPLSSISFLSVLIRTSFLWPVFSCKGRSILFLYGREHT